MERSKEQNTAALENEVDDKDEKNEDYYDDDCDYDMDEDEEIIDNIDEDETLSEQVVADAASVVSTSTQPQESTISQTKVTGPKGLKRKMEHAETNGEKGGNQRPKKIINITSKEDFTAPESDHTLLTNSYDIWLNLPDLPFNVFMMSHSTTQIRILTQVSSSWRKRITKNILENPARKTDLRVRSERALGPGMLPSKEEITNAMWLGK